MKVESNLALRFGKPVGPACALNDALIDGPENMEVTTLVLSIHERFDLYPLLRETCT